MQLIEQVCLYFQLKEMLLEGILNCFLSFVHVKQHFMLLDCA